MKGREKLTDVLYEVAHKLDQFSTKAFKKAAELEFKDANKDRGGDGRKLSERSLRDVPER